MKSSKTIVVVFSLLLAGAILWPITENWKEKPADDFPFSYYPMFSFKRGAYYTLHYIVGYDSANTRHCIPFQYIGSGGFNQVRRQLNKKVKKSESDELLADVKRRILKADVRPYCDLAMLKLVQGTFNLDSYFLNKNKTPQDEQVVAFTLMTEK
jgi:hypothetical protein